MLCRTSQPSFKNGKFFIQTILFLVIYQLYGVVYGDNITTSVSNGRNLLKTHRKLLSTKRTSLLNKRWIIVFKRNRITDVNKKVDDILRKARYTRRTNTVVHTFSGVLSGAALRLTGRPLLFWFLEDEDVDWVEEDQVLVFDAFLDESNITSVSNRENRTAQTYSSSGETIQWFPPWGLDRIDKAYSSLDLQYTYKYDGKGVDIYIIDTGIEEDTSDLGYRVECEMDISDSDCEDVINHGTKVAGVAAGKYHGVAKRSNIKAIKVFDKKKESRVSDVIAALEFVRKKKTNNRAVVNLSLGTDSQSVALDFATNRLVTNYGIVVVVAAGNKNKDACKSSPASASEAITVAASSDSDAIWKQSNYGPCVDIVAPGVNILTTTTTGKDNAAYVTGTSFAAPFVSGVVALFLERYPDASTTEIRTRVLSGSAVDQLKNDTDIINRLVSTEFIDAPIPAPVVIPAPSPAISPVQAPTTIGCGVLILSTCESDYDCCSRRCWKTRMFGKRCWFHSNIQDYQQ